MIILQVQALFRCAWHHLLRTKDPHVSPSKYGRNRIYKDPILYEGAKDEAGWQDEKGEDETYEKQVKIIST